MAGRIGRAFEAARRDRRGAFIPFLTSGFPDLVESDRLASALCEEGADVLELGIPFSDPLADGPVIQRTSQQALDAGSTPAHVLGQALRLRSRYETPIVLMTYLNPIVRYGVAAFADDAAASGVDGTILVDLPPEEDPATWDALREAGLDTVTLIAPTTRPERFPRIASRATGFLYVVARLGVTGGGANDPGLPETLRRCREHSALPRCLGFGLGPKSDLTPFRGLAEGIIVGSSLLAAILEGANPAAREAAARGTARGVRERLGSLAAP
jgi:tryptophan synthase alpha chain